MSQNRLTDKIFLLVVTIILVSPALLKVTANNGVQFPSWLGLDRTKSVIEGRKYTELPTLSREDFSSGTFQATAEKYMSDIVPARDTILFGNAGLQRCLIGVANTPFGFSSIHTYYDSKYLLNDGEIVTYTLSKKGQNSNMSLQAFGEGLSSVAARHPEKRFVVYVVDASNNSESNRAISLISNVQTTKFACNILAGATAEAENIQIISKQYSSIDDYRNDFYSTDHHWNIRGASRAYNLIARMLGLRAFDPEPVQVVGNTSFSGSSAASGLCPLHENPVDTSFDFSELTLLDNDGNRIDDAAHEDYWRVDELTRRRNFYDCWYGWRNMSPMIRGNGEGTAVLISDSYGSAMKRIIALNYNLLYTDSDLHADSSDQNLKLEDRLSREDIKDVIFVANVNNYIGMSKKMPSYFAAK